MGLTMAPFGVFGGVWAVSLPQLLASQHVPEATIATVSALSALPTSIGFLLCPVLDVGISRRAWASLSAVGAAVLLFAALMCRVDVSAVTLLMFLGWVCATLFQAAAYGWLGSLIPAKDRPSLAAWSTVANTGAGGVAVMIAMPLLRHLPFTLGAGLLSLAVVAPILPFAAFRSPRADRALTVEGVRLLARDIGRLFRRPQILRLLVLFCAPAAAFALTNNLGGIGAQFGASEGFVSLIGGAGVMVAGVVGSLVVPRLIGRVAPVRLYLLIGAVGAVFTLALAVTRHTPATFALAMLGENLFQAAAFSASFAIAFQSLGEANPLAATQMALLTAAGNAPITYMQIVDGHAFGLGGVRGSLLADGGVSLVACLALAAWLWRRPSVTDGSAAFAPAPTE
jgi:PAT family beta-lactamase induction signal transducer AmpG